MTDEEAKEMLAALSKHYRTPVKPINEYCDALKTWQRCLHDRALRQREKCFPGIHTLKSEDVERKGLWEKYNAAKKLSKSKYDNNPEQYRLWHYESDCEQVDFVFLQIQKSALLDRLLYCGLPLSHKMCPKHQGRWSGLFGECEHGCELTGWILPKPEPTDGG